MCVHRKALAQRRRNPSSNPIWPTGMTVSNMRPNGVRPSVRSDQHHLCDVRKPRRHQQAHVIACLHAVHEAPAICGRIKLVAFKLILIEFVCARARAARRMHETPHACSVPIIFVRTRVQSSPETVSLSPSPLTCALYILYAHAFGNRHTQKRTRWQRGSDDRAPGTY